MSRKEIGHVRKRHMPRRLKKIVPSQARARPSRATARTLLDKRRNSGSLPGSPWLGKRRWYGGSPSRRAIPRTWVAYLRGVKAYFMQWALWTIGPALPRFPGGQRRLLAAPSERNRSLACCLKQPQTTQAEPRWPCRCTHRRVAADQHQLLPLHRGSGHLEKVCLTVGFSTPDAGTI